MGRRIRRITKDGPIVACGVDATDLRGGAALVVAALGAEGVSRIEGLSHIDRGYHGLEKTLGSLGACIQRLEEDRTDLPNL